MFLFPYNGKDSRQIKERGAAMEPGFLLLMETARITVLIRNAKVPLKRCLMLYIFSAGDNITRVSIDRRNY
jgi:hypothetical protein